MKRIAYRIGNGFDVHRFADGDFIMLAGLKIPHTKSIEAHSDGDVLIHALCDAMLGALALGDIGKHFPDTDEQYKGIASSKLLQHVNELIIEHGYVIGNLDLTVIAEAPKLSTHILNMRGSLSSLLNCDIGNISIKATTTEQLGFTGRKEGIAVQASVMLVSDSGSV